MVNSSYKLNRNIILSPSWVTGLALHGLLHVINVNQHSHVQLTILTLRVMDIFGHMTHDLQYMVGQFKPTIYC